VRYRVTRPPRFRSVVAGEDNTLVVRIDEPCPLLTGHETSDLAQTELTIAWRTSHERRQHGPVVPLADHGARPAGVTATIITHPKHAQVACRLVGRNDEEPARQLVEGERPGVRARLQDPEVWAVVQLIADALEERTYLTLSELNALLECPSERSESPLTGA